MKIQTLNDLALTVAAVRQDLGRLKDALPFPRASLGESTSTGASNRNESVDAHIEDLRGLVDLDRLRDLVETLAA